jgi:hypothetical protein
MAVAEGKASLLRDGMFLWQERRNSRFSALFTRLKSTVATRVRVVAPNHRFAYTLHDGE